jgi:hypothetical protein
VPEDVRLSVGELSPESVADSVEHPPSVRPLRVDERAVEVEQVKVVVGDGHR